MDDVLYDSDWEIYKKVIHKDYFFIYFYAILRDFI